MNKRTVLNMLYAQRHEVEAEIVRLVNTQDYPANTSDFDVDRAKLELRNAEREFIDEMIDAVIAP